MTRLSNTLALALPLFLVQLLWLGWTELHGFTAQAVTQLWAKALVQTEVSVQFTATDAFYPPVPYALTLLLQPLTGASRIPTPFILSAATGTLLLMFLYRNLRLKGGYSAMGCLVLIALLAVNPYFLRALANGPETMLTLMGSWIFARGIVNLRLTGNAPDMMKVAVGLLIIALSDNYGLLISFGALPFLIIAARPSMISTSSVGYLFAMFYPVAAAIASIYFVSRLFNSALLPQLVDTPSQFPLREHIIIVSGLLSVALITTFRHLMIPRLFMPLLAVVCTMASAYFLNIFLHIEKDPVVAAIPLLATIVVGLRFWPPSRLREPVALALLSFAILQSAIAVSYTSAMETRSWARAAIGEREQSGDAARATADFLHGRSGIMLDVERNPEMVVAIGDVGNLLTAGTQTYDWALEGGLPQAPYILVPRRELSTAVADRILRRFPELTHDRLHGYDQIYENAGWRVFERTGF